MTIEKVTYNPDSIRIQLATNEEQIHAAQMLRYSVFYDEYGAKPSPQMASEKRDFDEYDSITDHLIVLDLDKPEGQQQVIGTYRLLRHDVAMKHGKFYTSSEYNISPLLNNEGNLLELGRSCVLAPYRTRPILQKLWEGIAHYVAEHNIDLMFGCASFHGTDIKELSLPLSYLYHYHLAPAEKCPRALDSLHVEMNIHAKESFDAKKAFMTLPPLIKGYLRLGAFIGDGAVIDEQFNTTDVCIVMPTEKIAKKYMRHYERKTQRPISNTSIS